MDNTNDKIAGIIDPSFKTGVSAKTQKPWSLMKIKTEQGKEATIFAPANIGDEVKVTWDEQFKVFKAERVTAQSKARDEITQKLDLILRNQGVILRQLTGGSQGGGEVNPQVAPQAIKEEPNPAPAPNEELPW